MVHGRVSVPAAFFRDRELALGVCMHVNVNINKDRSCLKARLQSRKGRRRKGRHQLKGPHPQTLTRRVGSGSSSQYHHPYEYCLTKYL